MKKVNPFKDKYCRDEIKKLNCPEIEYANVKITKKNIVGRCDDFLNVNFRAGDTEIKDCPIFLRDGHIWMSLTPMEVQSQYLPIHHGSNSERVATVGLGIGYFTVMVMASPKVKVLDVYEIDPQVIEVFKKNFSDREGFEKVNYIVGDFRKTFKKKEYDFCYLDPYQTLLPDELQDDYVMLHEKNKIKLLRPWGIEKCFVGQDGPEDIVTYLAMHKSNLRDSYYDEDYDERVRMLIGHKEDFDY